MGMMSPAQASVAQLDRVLPSEGRGRGFESRRVHHILVSGCLRQSTKHPKKPALCGLSCFWLSVQRNYRLAFVISVAFTGLLLNVPRRESSSSRLYADSSRAPHLSPWQTASGVVKAHVTTYPSSPSCTHCARLGKCSDGR